MSYYYCPECSGILKRDNQNSRIKSVCTQTGKKVFITKITDADKFAEKLRKKFLKNMIEINSFPRFEQLFIKQAFEQGAKVVFNSLQITPFNQTKNSI